MAQTGRNDPCPCGSGKKYKKCCLERDEAERRALSAAAADAGPDEWDEFEDPTYGDEEFPPLTADDVMTIGYASGMVKSRRRALEGEGLAAVEWASPAIPREILDVIERDQVADLEGTWGDLDAATPIQVEIVDIETADGDIITIESFNRGVLLLTENTEETRRLHRFCEVLRTTPARPVVQVPFPHEPLDDDDEPGVEPAPLPPVPQRGTCVLCGIDLAPAGAAAHLASCAPTHDTAKGPRQELVHLRVTAPGLPWYWLDVEIRAGARLDALDQFLRDTWLECCGHLSQFVIGEVDYVRVKSEDLGWEKGLRRRAERSMQARVHDALPGRGAHVSYEYDFGTTTTLDIEILGARTGSIGRLTTRLLAQNSPVVWTCATCGEPAACVCTLCVYDGASALACERHGRGRHRCGESEAFLPVVNSPRMGLCGYTGA